MTMESPDEVLSEIQEEPSDAEKTPKTLKKKKPNHDRKKIPWVGDIAAHGLKVAPPNLGEAHLVFAAKESIEQLTFFDRIYALFALGRGITEIVNWAAANDFANEVQYSRSTFMKYLTVYRKYVVPPKELAEQMEEARRKMGNDRLREKPAVTVNHPATSSQVMQLIEVNNGIEEARILDKAIALQWARVEGARAKEENLGGFLLPGLKGELDTLTKLCQTSRDMKSDIGMLGYERVPDSLNLRVARSDRPKIDYSKLTPEDREAVGSFVGTLMELTAPSENPRKVN